MLYRRFGHEIILLESVLKSERFEQNSVKSDISIPVFNVNCLDLLILFNSSTLAPQSNHILPFDMFFLNILSQKTVVQSCLLFPLRSVCLTQMAYFMAKFECYITCYIV